MPPRRPDRHHVGPVRSAALRAPAPVVIAGTAALGYKARMLFLRGFAVLAAVTSLSVVPQAPAGFLPGDRVLLDAHNAYPDAGRWADRLDRALATGMPLAVEQDLAWCRPAGSDRFESVVSHEADCRGDEPTLRAYFFDRIRPLIERALEEGPSADWPLVTLNLDFKTNEPAHHAAVWALLGEHEDWLTTASRGPSSAAVTPLSVGPLLVLTGEDDRQQRAFFDRVPVGGRLRVFGAVHTVAAGDATGLPRPEAATTYRRWWNHPWRVVEPGGPTEAGSWTRADADRLAAVVRTGHAAGLWVRFYTLDGHAADRSQGWSDGYNFGSVEAAGIRWRATIAAGVDFVATDQYERFAGALAAAGATDPTPAAR